MKHARTIALAFAVSLAMSACKSRGGGDAPAPPPASTSPTGVASQVLKSGTGTVKPVPNDTVKVSFIGTKSDGETFARGDGATFHLARAIPGWIEVLEQMVVGEKRRVWVPPSAAYQDAPDAPAGVLVFDLELLDVTHGPAAPPDVAAPPGSGFAAKVIAAGKGTVHPTINDSVTVTFASWTADGKPLQRGEEVPIRVALAIPGWRRALPEMVAGETRRLWVPPELAYAGETGAPAGTITFDLTLLDVQPGPTPPADVAAPPARATRSKDGLASKVLVAGTGREHPGANDGVRVSYSAWHRDGQLVDESGDEPVVRPVAGFEGWTEGLRQMVPGETRVFWVPAALGPGAGVETTLVVQLHEILTAPTLPRDARRPPPGAIVERDGLASMVLEVGGGTVHPTDASVVTVEYAAWTSDGRLIDATSTRGAAATVAVGGDMPGWAEALALMVEGERRRVWMPARLGFPGQPDAPQGPLVFDIRLLKIEPGA
jgi:peptidylprolyl isomerase